VIPSSQHPSTRAGAESIQLIYSGRALRALSDLARQFRCHPIFLAGISNTNSITKCTLYAFFFLNTRINLFFKQRPLFQLSVVRSSLRVRTLECLISHTPSQPLKMALAVLSCHNPLRTRCSPPPPFAKESSSVGHALTPHRLVPLWLHPYIHSSNGLVCILSVTPSL